MSACLTLNLFTQPLHLEKSDLVNILIGLQLDCSKQLCASSKFQVSPHKFVQLFFRCKAEEFFFELGN